MRTLSPQRLLLAALLGGASACSSPAPGTFSQIYTDLFPVHTKAQCEFCHSLPPNELSNGALSTGMDKAAAYASLVGKPSMSKTCAGRTLVVPGHPEESLFYEKLSGAPTCGGPMPLGGSALTADQLEAVRSWIEAGAPND
ncbi:Hypothetical protein A7982_03909 [Minicystis rosea]|nr:Hypothetical protein A7982_03909 [Minicystis rosea]